MSAMRNCIGELVHAENSVAVWRANHAIARQACQGQTLCHKEITMEATEKSKLVSIIVPAYNVENYIKACLSSILEQTYRAIEVIVVNDGSTDRTRDRIEALQVTDDRIHLLSQDNQGVAAARNAGIAVAKGEYLCFVDGDDRLVRDCIDKMVKTAEEAAAQMVFCGYRMIREDGSFLSDLVPAFYERGRREEWAYRITSAGARLYSRSFWQAHYLAFCEEPGARAEDLPIATYVNAMAESIACVREPLYLYVQRSDSAMHSQQKVPFYFPQKTFQQMTERIKKQGVVNSQTQYDVGILKVLAHFYYVIYRKAPATVKKDFDAYACALIGQDFVRMSRNWRKMLWRIDLPLSHKGAVTLYVMHGKINGWGRRSKQSVT